MPDIKKLLRGALDELEAEERSEEQASRDQRLTELERAVREELPGTISTAVREELRRYIEQDDDDSDDAEPEPEPEPEGEQGKPAKPKTRPGRKSGQAYDWYVDDQGEVARSDVAIVFTGEDEPDEVALEGEE